MIRGVPQRFDIRQWFGGRSLSSYSCVWGGLGPGAVWVLLLVLGCLCSGVLMGLETLRCSFLHSSGLSSRILVTRISRWGFESCRIGLG